MYCQVGGIRNTSLQSLSVPNAKQHVWVVKLHVCVARYKHPVSVCVGTWLRCRCAWGVSEGQCDNLFLSKDSKVKAKKREELGEAGERGAGTIMETEWDGVCWRLGTE